MKATIQDVARKAGVSKTLVSMYLSGYRPPEQFSEESRRRMDEAVRILDYRPSAVARGLRKGRSWLIGLMIGNIANHFSAFLAQSLLNEAIANGYQLLIVPTRFNREEEAQCLRTLQDRQVDGIIYHLWIYSGNIRRTKCPVLQTLSADDSLESFGFDVAEALDQAVEKVRMLGKHSICLIANEVNSECRLISDWKGECRKAADKRALAFESLGYTYGMGDRWLKTLCERRPEVIFASSRLRVTEIMEYIEEHNIQYHPGFVYSYSLPSDFIRNEQVIGVIRLPFKTWTKECMKLMIEMVENAEYVKQHSRIRADFLEPEDLYYYYMEQKQDKFYQTT